MWNAANIWLKVKFIVKKNIQNQISKHQIKNLEKEKQIRPQKSGKNKDSKNNKCRIENQKSHKMIICKN